MKMKNYISFFQQIHIFLNSEFLSGVKANIDTNVKIRKSIEQNRKLREILGNEGSKEELKQMLQAMLAELENN